MTFCDLQVVGRNKGSQSVMLSWFGSAGSLARIVFPIISGGKVQRLACYGCFLVDASLTPSGR
jgi:hypothetical protein